MSYISTDLISAAICHRPAFQHWQRCTFRVARPRLGRLRNGRGFRIGHDDIQLVILDGDHDHRTHRLGSARGLCRLLGLL